MGTSRSGLELAGKVGQLQQSLENTRPVVMGLAMHGKNAAIAGLARGGAHPGKSSRTGLRMPSARFDIRGTRNPTALLRATGVAHWWERGTKPHTIISRKYGGSRASRGQVTTGPGMFRSSRRRGAVTVGTQPFAYARHPGRKPTPFWGDTKTAVQDEAPRALREDTQRKLSNAFR